MKIADFLKVAAGVVGAIIVLLKPVDWYIQYSIAEYNKANPRKGGFRADLAEEIGVDEKRVSIAFGEMYRELHGAVGDIDTFRHKYMPMLEKEQRTIDVGLKVINGNISYLHESGITYIPAKDPNSGKYYILFTNGRTEWCN